jgi:Flp pilus assembly protein TadG
MITVLVALIALIGAVGLSVDGGLLLAARTQMQNASDASALAAGRNMIDSSGPSVTLTAATTAAVDQGSQNFAATTAAITILGSDVTFGNWDLDTSTFDSGVDLTDPEQVTAVRVLARLDGSTTGSVPAFLSRVLGHSEFAVGADATAYLGWAGSFAVNAPVLPIAIDCCKLKGSPNCDQDYCATITTNPPNPCALVDPQTTGANNVSCLEFANTPDQNACWTGFNPNDPQVSTPIMTDTVENGSAYPISTDTPVYIDNGTKVPVVGEINDKFQGTGSYLGAAEGVDRYLPINDPPIVDSWVTALPVIECQDAAHCAGGSPMKIVGVVCFEIREITVTPDKIIRGRFLCPGDPLFDECDLGLTGTGGEDFGIRADIPVLVQ